MNELDLRYCTSREIVDICSARLVNLNANEKMDRIYSRNGEGLTERQKGIYQGKRLLLEEIIQFTKVNGTF